MSYSNVLLEVYSELVDCKAITIWDREKGKQYRLNTCGGKVKVRFDINCNPDFFDSQANRENILRSMKKLLLGFRTHLRELSAADRSQTYQLIAEIEELEKFIQADFGDLRSSFDAAWAVRSLQPRRIALNAMKIRKVAANSFFWFGKHWLAALVVCLIVCGFWNLSPRFRGEGVLLFRLLTNAKPYPYGPEFTDRERLDGLLEADNLREFAGLNCAYNLQVNWLWDSPGDIEGKIRHQCLGEEGDEFYVEAQNQEAMQYLTWRSRNSHCTDYEERLDLYFDSLIDSKIGAKEAEDRVLSRIDQECLEE